jgi:flagellar basal-body rod modification protein FlgD
MSAVAGLFQANQLSEAAPTTGTDALGKDAFMKLLLIQMKHQDPLDPLDNQDMLAQMAQFSSLEQMSNLNKNFNAANQVGSFMDATRLLGKEVQVLDPSSSEIEPGVITSKVASVNFTNSGPLVTLENGVVTTVQEIVKVSEPVSQ